MYFVFPLTKFLQYLFSLLFQQCSKELLHVSQKALFSLLKCFHKCPMGLRSDDCRGKSIALLISKLLQWHTASPFAHDVAGPSFLLLLDSETKTNRLQVWLNPNLHFPNVQFLEGAYMGFVSCHLSRTKLSRDMTNCWSRVYSDVMQPHETFFFLTCLSLLHITIIILARPTVGAIDQAVHIHSIYTQKYV